MLTPENHGKPFINQYINMNIPWFSGIFPDAPGAAGGAAPPGAVLGAARRAAAAAVDAQLEDAAQLSEPRGRFFRENLLGNSWDTHGIIMGNAYFQMLHVWNIDLHCLRHWLGK